MTMLKTGYALLATAALLLGACVTRKSLIPPDPDRLKVVPKVTGVQPLIPQMIGPMKIRPKAWWDAGKPNMAKITYMGKITRMTIHHEGTETANNEMSLDGVVRRLRITRKVHMNAFGWGDIGYHFCIDRAGRIWEARSMRFRGAHAGNAETNQGNIGIELMGNFEKQKVNDTQKRSLRWLIKKLMSDYKIRVSEIYTHREIRKKYRMGMTICPGRDLQLYMDSLRQELRRQGR